MDEKDNVAVVLAETAENEEIRIIHQKQEAGRMTVKEPIGIYHKVALRPIRPGDKIIKYGEIIGMAVKPIAAGEHVHVHNIRSTFGEKNEN